MVNSFGYQETKKWAKVFLAQGLVPMIWGSGGIGKSALAKEIAAEANLHIIDCRLGNMEATDIPGFPAINDRKRSEHFPFEHFPLATDTPPNGTRGWLLLLDEFTNADESTQKAAYEVIYDRTVGSKPLHKDVHIMCMGNGARHGANTTDLTDPMKSRLCHLHMATNAKDWVSHYAVPAGLDYRITSWIGSQPEMLDNYADMTLDADTYSCPRTVEALNTLISHSTLVNETFNLSTHYAIFSGVVGETAAKSFIDHCALGINLPDIATILADPKNTAVPTKNGEQFMLASRLSHEIDSNNATLVMQYLERLPNQEYIVTCLRSIAARSPVLATHPAMISWLTTKGISLM